MPPQIGAALRHVAFLFIAIFSVSLATNCGGSIEVGLLTPESEGSQSTDVHQALTAAASVRTYRPVADGENTWEADFLGRDLLIRGTSNSTGLVRFSIPNIGAVKRATLRLTIPGISSNSAVRARIWPENCGAWTEERTHLFCGYAAHNSIAAYQVDVLRHTADFDVSNLVFAESSPTFFIGDVDFRARESASPPRLIVETASLDWSSSQIAIADAAVNSETPNTPDGHGLTVVARNTQSPAVIGSGLFSFMLPSTPVQRATVWLMPDTAPVTGAYAMARCGAVSEDTTVFANYERDLPLLEPRWSFTQLTSGHALKLHATAAVNAAITQGCTAITIEVLQGFVFQPDLSVSFRSREAAENRPRIFFE